MVHCSAYHGMVLKLDLFGKALEAYYPESFSPAAESGVFWGLGSGFLSGRVHLFAAHDVGFQVRSFKGDSATVAGMLKAQRSKVIGNRVAGMHYA